MPERSALEAALYEVLVEKRVAHSTAYGRLGTAEENYLTPLVRALATAVQQVTARSQLETGETGAGSPLTPEERETLAYIVYEGGPSREDFLAGLEHWINTAVIADRATRTHMRSWAEGLESHPDEDEQDESEGNER